ncbi:MAG: type IV pili methyl-accepting chemotaxis transducer N-terminal domain-containing protein, partial [Burkholderiaceae bacterium]|nr:type IV pili methyl-accepting chemotaxis transducer N-terminal domain-containing protein [Burkholderiaceae bacterium]
MRQIPTLTTKLMATGCAFLFLAMVSIGLTLWVTWKLEGGAAAINEAGRLRMYTVRMALALKTGDAERLEELSGKFGASLDLLRAGTSMRPLFVPWSEDAHTRFADVAGGWTALHAAWIEARPDDTSQAVRQADAFVGRVDHFVDAIETQIARWTAALHVFQIFMLGMAVIAATVFMAMSFLLVLAPVSRMQQALARVRQGDLGTRVPVDSEDEFGQLAEGFNLMAGALQTSHEDLERKVREKTASVEIKNQRLSALYGISAMASDAGSLASLAQGFVQQVRKVAGADAAVVRWSDEANERYVILAADGLPQAIAQGEQCLHAGACFCGPVGEQPRTRVIPIAVHKGILLPHCHEVGYETLVAIPVMVQHRVLGELNLFFRSGMEVGSELRDLLEAMVRHLASSMEGLRAIALEREAAVAEERSLLARELHDSIAQSLAFLKIQTQLLRDAVAKGNHAARDRSIAELDVGVRECYADVRELLVHFRTRANEEDIEGALRSTLSKFEHQTGIGTELSLTGHGLPLPPDMQIQILHIVQEALSNVRKHAQASRVQVLVQRHPWHFEVRDDGVGFDMREAPSPDSLHVGRGIMRERAERIGAMVQWRSAPGQGATVLIELPERPAIEEAAVAGGAVATEPH